MEDKQIVIRPVVKAKFSGVSAHTKSVTAIDGAQLDKAGNYKTGLTREEETEYEKKLNLPTGTLNRRNSDFWGTCLQLRLPNDKPYYFSTSSSMDELKLKVIEQRNDIASNELEMRKMPFALFYIEDKEAKAKVEEIAIDFQMEASDIFSDLTTDEKKGYLKLYGEKGTDNVSDRVVKTALFKKMNEDPKKFIPLTKDPDVKIRISIEDMLEKGLLKRKGNYYNYQDEVIGNSVDAVIAFFKDLKNQSLKITMEAEAKKISKGKTKE
jgi:hypothetical protein